MRLITCHIENFGKLNNFSFDFEEGTNVICADNGWGKSSFAAFIRAMFYGLDDSKKRDLAENDRKRYIPWQGGVFGGSLTFETEGKEYIITRRFGKKPADDSFELRDARTNLISSDFSENIGEEIFRINKKSFMRSVFIGQGDCGAGVVDGTGVTGDINAKVGNLADDTGDLNNYETAFDRLESILSKMNPSRVTGSIKKRENEIAALEREILGGNYLPGKIDETRGNIAKAKEMAENRKKELGEITALQQKVSAYQALQGKKDEWGRLKKNLENRQAELERVDGFFPKGVIPEIQAINNALVLCGELAGCRERVALYELSEQEQTELLTGNQILAAGIPDEEEIDGTLADIAVLADLRQKINAGVMSDAEVSRLAELAQEFEGESENLTALTGKWNTRCNKKATYATNSATVSMMRISQNSAKKPLGIGIVLVILGLVLAAGAVFMATFGSILGTGNIGAAIGLFFFGIIVTVIGVVLRGRDKSSEPDISSRIDEIQAALDRDLAYIDKVDREAESYLGRHGRFFNEDTVMMMLQEIYDESYEYNNLKKRAEAAAGNADIEKADELSHKISSFLMKYGMSADEPKYTEAIYKLRGLCSRTLDLREKYRNHENALARMGMVQAEITEFLNEFGFEPESDLPALLNSIKDKADEHFDAVEALGRAKSELEEFEQDTDTSLLIIGGEKENMPSLEVLHARVLEITEEQDGAQQAIAGMQSDLEALQEEFDEWEENKVRLEELKNIQDDEKKQYSLLTLTKIKLEAAKHNMTSKYSDPILNGFVKYFSMITGDETGGFHIDANINVTVDAYGSQRTINTLSSGYKDLIGVCLRLALVDAMYKAEAPVIIMDDPFTNLDDGKVAAAREFVDKVSEKYQVVYFTCSRMRG